MKKAKGKRREAVLASLFYFPLFLLALASCLAFFGLLLLAVLTVLLTLVLSFFFRIFLGDDSPWKARSRAEDCATLLLLGALFLGSYLILSL